MKRLQLIISQRILGSLIRGIQCKRALFAGFIVGSLTIGGASTSVLADAQKESQGYFEVYAWGWGTFGQLGIGNERTQHLPQRIEELKGQNIIKIDAKKAISAALSKDGSIYTWGKSKGGVLGVRDNTSMNIALPTRVDLPAGEKFVDVSCGALHMAAINEKGEVYTWGNEGHGKLGHSFKKEDLTPSKTSYYTRNNLQAGALPQKIEGVSGIKQTACGQQHTVLLTNQGEVLTVGQNRKGVLGYEFQGAENPQVQKVEALSNTKILKIDAGLEFNLALSENGEVYAWGNNDYGQLGNSSTSQITLPLKIQGLSNIVEISCGDYFCAALSKDGSLYTWGYGADGQLGHANNQDLHSPKQVQFEQKVVRVGCGGGHIGIITDDKKLYLFGRGKEGQLGRGDSIESEASYRNQPREVVFFKNRKVQLVKCGGEHTIALVQQ